MENDSLDISQLKHIALHRESLIHGASTNIEPTITTARSDRSIDNAFRVLRKYGHSQASSAPTALGLELEKPSGSEGQEVSKFGHRIASNRMSNGTQKSGCTEPLSPWVFANGPASTSRLGARQEQLNDPAYETYKTDETGHVEFENLSQLALEQDEDNDDLQSQEFVGIGGISPVDVAKELHIAPQTLRPPKTPMAGQKRDHSGNVLDNTYTTPRLPPLNPFAVNGGSNEKAYSLSQAFKLTQAPSSPSANALPSDGASNKPTPGMQYGNRPSTAGPSSPPQKIQRSSIRRSTTEPYTRWNVAEETNVNLPRLSSPSAAKSRYSPPLDTDDLLNDDQFDGTQARQFKERQKSERARRQLSHVTAKKGELRASRYGISKTPFKSSQRSTKSVHRPFQSHIVVSDDTPTSDESGEETEREVASLTSNEDEPDELAEDNKENIGARIVQYPRPLAKGPTTLRSHHGDIQSPALGRKHTEATYDEASFSEELVGAASPLQQECDASGKSGPVGSLNQPVAIADSQASPSSQKARDSPHDKDAEHLPASNDSRKVIRESQPFKIPNTSQLDSSYARKTLMHSSSPHRSSTAMQASPSSKNTSLYNTGKDHSTLIDSCQPASSPPQLTEGHGPVSISRITDGIRRRFDREEPSLSDPEQSALSKTTLPQAVPSVSKHNLLRTEVDDESQETPLKRRTILATTIPETGSIARHHFMELAKIGESSSRSSPIQTKDSRSTTSAQFETAQSHTHGSQAFISTQTEKQAAHLSPQSKSPKPPIKMKELAEAKMPGEESDNIHLSFDILSDGDKDFQAKLDQLSSPVPPGWKRKRTKQGRGLDNRSNFKEKNFDLAPTNPSLVSKEHSADNNGLNPAVSKIASNSAQLLETEKLAPADADVRKIHFLAKDRHENQNLQTDNCNLLNHQTNVGQCPNQKDTFHELGRSINEPGKESVTASAHGANFRQGSTTTPIVTTCSTSALNDGEHEIDEKISESVLTHPFRVFAFFKGSPLGYYPATCVSPNMAETKLTVRFDDGSECSLSSGQVKRLELRKGDIVRIDQKGLRGNLFTVYKTKFVSDNQYDTKFTDIYGNNAVDVRMRTKSGAENQNPILAFPMTLIYFTTHMFSSIKDRRPFAITKDESININDIEQLSSTRSTSPSTPSVRHRSAKQVYKATIARPQIVAPKSEGRLFPNYVFVTTSITNTEVRERIEALMRANGGRVLENGFEELFLFSSRHGPQLVANFNNSEPSSSPSAPNSEEPHGKQFDDQPPLILRSAANKSSPVLLIADKHSRNTKFFQALSLGIPCLHTRWILDCTNLGRIIDWRPYLLASGESTFLGGAIVSRHLPGVADTLKVEQWCLQTLIDNRSKWLDGKRVLLVGSGTSSIMEAYVFIALALGAKEVSVANGKDEARQMLQEKKRTSDIVDSHYPEQCGWDYVCVNEEEKFDGDGQSSGSRKARSARRKKPGKPDHDDTSFLNIFEDMEGMEDTKMVGTECVVQSLILGRLLEQAEIENL